MDDHKGAVDLLCCGEFLVCLPLPVRRCYPLGCICRSSSSSRALVAGDRDSRGHLLLFCRVGRISYRIHYGSLRAMGKGEGDGGRDGGIIHSQHMFHTLTFIVPKQGAATPVCRLVLRRLGTFPPRRVSLPSSAAWSDSPTLLSRGLIYRMLVHQLVTAQFKFITRLLFRLCHVFFFFFFFLSFFVFQFFSFLFFSSIFPLVPMLLEPGQDVFAVPLHVGSIATHRILDGG